MNVKMALTNVLNWPSVEIQELIMKTLVVVILVHARILLDTK